MTLSGTDWIDETLYTQLVQWVLGVGIVLLGLGVKGKT
jgi:hypothetical protein